MSRIRLALAAALVTGLVATASVSAAMPKLAGSVGPGFVISLKKNGVKVTKLKPGKYTLTVSDKSKIHNFRIKGPGLNKPVTTVAFVGTKTVTITLKAGKYTYDCDPHFAAMHASFRVA